jgi:hypothetical protein
MPHSTHSTLYLRLGRWLAVAEIGRERVGGRRVGAGSEVKERGGGGGFG